MTPNNPLFHTNVSRLLSALNQFKHRVSLKDIYFSKHFLERAVERNIDNPTRIVQIINMVVAAYKDYKNHTFNAYSYKVLFKDIAMIIEIDIGNITNARRFVVKSIWDGDVYKKEEYSVTIKL